MQIVIVSDTHGMYQPIIEKLNTLKRIDLLIHLGDYVQDGERIAEELGVESIIVRGNGDPGSNYKDEEILTIEDTRIFITHGHKYDIKYNLNRLYYRGLELEADIVLFGHTHIPLIQEEGDILLFNPGSPVLPRGIKRQNTFGILELDDNKKASIINL